MKNRVNEWINTHKYAVTATAVAVICLVIINKKTGVVVVGEAKDIIPENDIYGYLTFG